MLLVALLGQESWDLVTQGCQSLRASVLDTAMEFQIHRPVLNCLELGDRPHVPVTYHEISSLDMENIGEYLYPQASLRREIFQQPAVPPLRRGPQVTCSSRGIGRTSISFQTIPTCPPGQRSFPLRGQSLSPSGIPNHDCQHFGCDHSLLGCESC